MLHIVNKGYGKDKQHQACVFAFPAIHTIFHQSQETCN